MSIKLLNRILMYGHNRENYTIEEQLIIEASFKEELRKDLEKRMESSFFDDNLLRNSDD